MVEKEEKPSSQNDTLNSSVNGDLDKLNVEKDEITPYERKYYALFQRCEIIKQSNERLINRIYHVKKLLRRRKKERKFLMDRLDGYGDDYKAVATSLFAERSCPSSPLRVHPDASLPTVMMDDDSPTRNSQGPKNEASVSGALQMDLDL